MSKIWRFATPPATDYARPFVPGALLGELETAKTLTIEWHPGSDEIGDISLVAGQELVVTEQVAVALTENFSSLSRRPVHMVQGPKRRPSKKGKKGDGPRIALSYNGPPLVNLRTEAVVEADLKRWPIVQDSSGTYYEVEGMEDFEERFISRFKSEPSFKRVPRDPKKGFFIDQTHLHHIDVFRLRDAGTRLADGTFDRSDLRLAQDLLGWILCTDSVKDFVEERSYTNITFLEMGETYQP